MNDGGSYLKTIFVLNRVVTKNREVTPCEGWNGRKLNVNFLRTWGYLAKVNLSRMVKHRRVLSGRTVKRSGDIM
jgi:hypothetical protein